MNIINMYRGKHYKKKEYKIISECRQRCTICKDLIIWQYILLQYKMIKFINTIDIYTEKCYNKIDKLRKYIIIIYITVTLHLKKIQLSFQNVIQEIKYIKINNQISKIIKRYGRQNGYIYG